MTDRAYVGDELDVFAHATRWKRYVATLLRPYIRGSVLEVGAGIGSTTRVYHNESVTRWVCLEPDGALARRIAADPPGVTVRVGTLADLEAEAGRFDTILYADVLEHIRDDLMELSRAVRLLRPQGCIAVVAPAHRFLFSPFDRAIGHYRRYDRGTLRAIAPGGVVEERIAYLDSAGMLASILNRLLLHSSRPTLSQILLWDRALVPVSVLLDRLLRYGVGKSIVAVWRRPAETMP